MKIKLWDLPTRLFHWVLVVSFAFLFFSGETGDAMELHMNVGIFVLGLLVFRIIWGFVGSESSRFTSFVTLNPAKVFAYIKTLPKRESSAHAGHNPLGGLVVVAMLLLLLLQGFTGLFNTDDVMYEGPLYAMVDEDFSDFMGGLHETVFKFLLLIVVMHVSAIIFYKVYKGINLVKPMILGWLDWKETGAGPTLFFKSAWLALGLFVISCVAVFLAVSWFAAGS